MLAGIKRFFSASSLINYYFPNTEHLSKFPIHEQDRELIIKKLLGRILKMSGVLATFYIFSLLFQIKIISALLLFSFLVSLIPYGLYGWAVKTLSREKKSI